MERSLAGYNCGKQLEMTEASEHACKRTVKGTKCDHAVGQLSPLSSSRIFSSCKTETPHPLNTNSPFPPPSSS